jgi:hypothetical protein
MVVIGAVTESIAGPLAQSMSAKGDVLTASRPLPVYPEQPTSSDRSSWSGSCQ